MARKRTQAYSKAYETVYEPGKSAATGFFKGISSGMEADRKTQQLMAPKMMEIQSRYQLEGMKEKMRQSDKFDKQTQTEKRDLQKQLHEIQKFYKTKKISLKEKMAEAEDDGDIFSKSKGTNPKVAKLQELYSQVEDSEMDDTKEILDQLKQYYQ